ncbi:MAG: DUF1573 domain-containing protein [Bacteroidetes bacterium]|nr:DUF1573 domain-containing protein [Bacteroidota bacterium]
MIAIIGFFPNAQAQLSEPDAAGAQITVDKEVHDYGTIEQGASGECVFIITNSGTEALLISECRGSCSCTIPNWPKEPIKPGETAQIFVKYDTNRVGPINKTVTITSNAVNSPVMMVRIKGNVTAKTTAVTPAAP